MAWVEIRYDRGCFGIHTEKFFPTSVAKINRLKKVVDKCNSRYNRYTFWMIVLEDLEKIEKQMEPNDKSIVRLRKNIEQIKGYVDGEVVWE